MSDMLILSVDVERLAANLSGSRGHPVSRAEAASWLSDNGFEPSGEHWIAEASVAAMLDNGEILGARPINEAARDGAMQQVSFESASEIPPYVLTEQRRAQLRAMPDYDACVVPPFMCGTPREVIDRWRPIAKRVFRKAEFGQAMNGTQFIHVDDAPGRLVFLAHFASRPRIPNVLTYPILSELSQLTYDMTKSRHSWYCVKRQLLLDGLDAFWFSLCFVANGGDFWRFTMPPGYEEDRAIVRRLAIEKVLRWWPHFCARNDRFAHLDGDPSPWPTWGSGLFSVFDSGSEWEFLSRKTCEEAGLHLRGYLEDGRLKMS